MGKWRDQENSWENYYAGLGQQQGYDLQKQQLMETRKRNMEPDPHLVTTIGDQGDKVQRLYDWKTGLPMYGRPDIPSYVEPEEPEAKKLKLVQLSTGEFANYDETTGKIYDPDTGEEIPDPQFYRRPLSPPRRGLTDYQRNQLIRKREEALQEVGPWEADQQEQIRRSYAAALVRYKALPGEKMSKDLARQYLNASKGDKSLAIQWAEEDGWDISAGGQ